MYLSDKISGMREMIVGRTGMNWNAAVHSVSFDSGITNIKIYIRNEEKMRLRNVTGSREKIAESKYTVNDAPSYKGRWHETFGNDNPLHIEIGMGKGKFITELAINNPNINYIGIEKYSSVLIRAIEKREELKTDNLLFIRMEAEYIEDVFATGEVEKIYLNFSDPWPKDRHAKRRLTSKEFFARYDRILKANGRVEFKTDNDMLYEFSLDQIPQAGFDIIAQTWDLHNNEKMMQGNVMTEYEEKFSGMGNPIHKLIAVKRKAVFFF